MALISHPLPGTSTAPHNSHNSPSWAYWERCKSIQSVNEPVFVILPDVLVSGLRNCRGQSKGTVPLLLFFFLILQLQREKRGLSLAVSTPE